MIGVVSGTCSRPWSGKNVSKNVRREKPKKEGDVLEKLALG